MFSTYEKMVSDDSGRLLPWDSETATPEFATGLFGRISFVPSKDLMRLILLFVITHTVTCVIFETDIFTIDM